MAGSIGAGGAGGQGLTAISFNANLTATYFPTTLTSQGTWSSGAGGSGQGLSNSKGLGGTGAGNGGRGTAVPASVEAPTAATMYGAGGGGGGSSPNQAGANGFAGVVIVYYALGSSGIIATGGQEVNSI